MTPDQIEAGMDGRLRPVSDGRSEALLPAVTIQNHAAFLARGKDGLACLWFGGSLEGKSDICVWRSLLTEGQWSEPEQISDDPDRSEQNPIQFDAPDGRRLFLHTAQVGGDQDACRVRLRQAGGAPVDLPLAPGTFIRAAPLVRDDGAWLLPLFRCVPRPGERWTGAHDTAAVAISADAGRTWRTVEVPDSIGCVHMTPVDRGDGHLVAFFRRRQADMVYRTTSADGGESWTPPAPTDVPNNNSSIAVIRLADGRIAMACNPTNAAEHPTARRASLYDELGESDDRPNASGGCTPIWGVPRAPMTLCLSDDDGQTFARRIVVEKGAGDCLKNDSVSGENREMSYPALSQASDGSLDLAYTYHRRAIKHVRLSLNWLESQ
ncbi:glycosyl hydrolase [Loktanella sp. SALINAS62]|nr:glycosyl hydrolase [Loktanella sp. SALINAS62]